MAANAPGPFCPSKIALLHRALEARSGKSRQIPEQLSFNAPSTLSHQIGEGVSVQLSANSTVGGTLTYGASGLPSGLSINPATGLISGTLAAGADLYGPYQATVTVTNGANSRLRIIDWSISAQLPGDFNQDSSVDGADYVVWRKLGGSQASYATWRANFGRTAATGSQALFAGSSMDELPLVSVDLATVSEDDVDGAETMNNQLELLIARDAAWSTVEPARPDRGQWRAPFYASQHRFDVRHSDLDNAFSSALQLAFAALTDGESDRADPFVFDKIDELDEPELSQESADSLFDPSIDFAEVFGKGCPRAERWRGGDSGSRRAE